MPEAPKPTPPLKPELSDDPELIHPASRLTLLSMGVWVQTFFDAQVPVYRRVPAKPLPPIPDISIGEEWHGSGKRQLEIQSRALQWELEAKASRFPDFTEEVEYQRVPTQGWAPLKFPGSVSPKEVPDPMLVLVSTSALLPFLAMCRSTIQLAPYQFRSANGNPVFERIAAPLLNLTDFEFQILATLPMEQHPELPLKTDPKMPPFVARAIEHINGAYYATSATLGPSSVWAPILPRSDHG